jgi:hypothetical protein
MNADQTETRAIALFITLQMQTPYPTIWVRRVVHPSEMQASKQLDAISLILMTQPYRSLAEAKLAREQPLNGRLPNHEKKLEM